MQIRIRGAYKYLPKEVIIQLKSIKQEEGIQADAEAFRKMASFSKIGQEVKKEVEAKNAKKRKKFYFDDILEMF